MLQRWLTVFCFVFLLISCKKKNETVQDAALPSGNYFSIVQFAQDQINSFGHQPFSFVKLSSLNGKKDSVYLKMQDMDWAGIYKIFFAADISNRKYVGKYNFSIFEDNVTITRTYYYEAKTDDLFTRNLQINTDPDNGKIKSIYIETAKKSWWKERRQKLFYKPVDFIQIQEFESGFATPDKEMNIVYRFM